MTIILKFVALLTAGSRANLFAAKFAAIEPLVEKADARNEFPEHARHYSRIWLVLGVLFASLSAWGQTCSGGNCTAASVGTTDVQNCINSTTAGHTCTIPAGSATWTSGVSLSGKGITIAGTGAGRIVAIDVETSALTLSTGTQTFTGVSGTGVTCCTSSLPTQVAPSLPNGTTLHVYELGNSQNSMTGTVTSFSGTTLVMSISSVTGTCGTGSSGTSPSNCKRWEIATVPQTVITNNSSTTLFTLVEDSSVNTRLSGIQFVAGTGVGEDVDIQSGGGQPIVIQNNWFRQNATSTDAIHVGVNHGVISGNSFDSTPFSMAPLAIQLQPYDTSAWSQAAFWGTADTGETNNTYIESNDFHGYLNYADNDEGARTVYRYNLMNNAGQGSHGADTGPLGSRTMEVYNNFGIYNGYNDGTTFPMNQWFFMRGGSFVVWQNVWPALVSTDYGTKDDVNMIIENLARNAGPAACWGAQTGTVTPGANRPAPHQVGYGYVTGTGTSANYTSIAGNLSITYPNSNCSSSTHQYWTTTYGYGCQYIGDLEPGYIWGNSRQPLANTAVSDYVPGANPCTGNTDLGANYIRLNTEYFNGSTAKPSYTAAAYPNPLVSATAATPTFSPVGGSYAYAQLVTISDSTPGSSIYWTGDGSTPTTSSALYSGPIVVNGSQVLHNDGNFQNDISGWNAHTNPSETGGVNAPASTVFSTGNTPTISGGGSIEVSETTIATSTQTNFLVVNNSLGACDTCTYLNEDFQIYIPSSTYSNASSYEMDQLNSNVTTNYLYMFGLQCNLSTHNWQYANETSSWADTGLNCTTPLTSNTWHHIQVQDHWVSGDTSCTGGVPTEHFDWITVDGVRTNWNLSICATTKPSGWSSIIANQFQIDIGATTGTAKTATMFLDEGSLAGSNGTGTTTTLKAIATASGYSNSAVGSAAYTITGIGSTGVSISGITFQGFKGVQ